MSIIESVTSLHSIFYNYSIYTYWHYVNVFKKNNILFYLILNFIYDQLLKLILSWICRKLYYHTIDWTENNRRVRPIGTNWIEGLCLCLSFFRSLVSYFSIHVRVCAIIWELHFHLYLNSTSCTVIYISSVSHRTTH